MAKKEKETIFRKETLDRISSPDQLTDYLDRLPHTGLPTGSISIKTENQELLRFVDWASTEGQGYLSPYGFLKANKALTALK